MGNIFALNIQLCDLPNCFNGLVKSLKYKTTVKKDLDELQKQMEMLLARKSGEKVDKVKIEVEKLKSSATQEKFCLGCFVANCGEKVKELLNEVNSLIETEHAGEVTERAIKIPCERTLIGLESTFKSVQECIDQENTGIVGLYGKGGVGKTALLNKINNMFCEKESRPVCVICVQGSRELQLEDLQIKILERIGVREKSLRDQSCQDKAVKIFTFLNEREFVLLLDDIWKRVDLQELGVPYPSRDNKSKVIFTTRLFEVCGQMKVDESFEVKCLAEREAQELFEEVVGRFTANWCGEIREHARFMANWCGGLPRAVIAIARHMSCITAPQEWAHARASLDRSPSLFPGMKEEVFSVLKRSFEHLSSDEVRFCFLYCSLFPKGHIISKIRLIDHWIGEGLLDEKYEAQDDGHSKIGTLVRAGLLEEVENGDVKMHDVIYEMALWISADEVEKNGKFFVHAGRGDPLTKMPDDAEEVRGVKRMSVMENKIETLPESPTYSTDHLETLFLNSNLFKRVSGGFFQHMPLLKVLNLSNNPLTEVPSEIANSVSLRHLDLSRTLIKVLPKEFKSLVELLCLNLEHTPQLHTIPKNLISSFKKLRVLRMLECGSLSPTAATDNVLSNDAGLFEELQGLVCLKILTITLKTCQAFQIFSHSGKLQTCTQSLRLQSLQGVQIVEFLLANLKSLQNLYIINCTELERIMIDCWPGVDTYFARLDTVIISSCPKLADLTWLILAPELERIVVSCCPHMKEIISVERLLDFPENLREKVPFEKLESLECQEMEDLQSIYWNTLPLPQLKKIGVVGCPQLKKLPLDSNSAQGVRPVIEGERQWFESLEWEDDAARDAFNTCFIHC